MNNLLQDFDNEVRKWMTEEQYREYLSLIDKRESESKEDDDQAH